MKTIIVKKSEFIYKVNGVWVKFDSRRNKWISSDFLSLDAMFDFMKFINNSGKDTDNILADLRQKEAKILSKINNAKTNFLKQHYRKQLYDVIKKISVFENGIVFYNREKQKI